LGRTSFDENIRAVISSVNPVELSALVTLAGSVMRRYFRDDILALPCLCPSFVGWHRKPTTAFFKALHGRNWLGVDINGVPGEGEVSSPTCDLL